MYTEIYYDVLVLYRHNTRGEHVDGLNTDAIVIKESSDVILDDYDHFRL